MSESVQSASSIVSDPASGVVPETIADFRKIYRPGTYFFRGASFLLLEISEDGIGRVIFQQLPMLFDFSTWQFAGRDESPSAIAWLDDFCRQNLCGDRAALDRHLAATWNGHSCPY